MYLPAKLKSRKIIDIIFDASGIKVFREGEWKVRTHGVSKRRSTSRCLSKYPRDPFI